MAHVANASKTTRQDKKKTSCFEGSNPSRALIVDGEDSDDPEAKQALQHEQNKDKHITKNNNNNENTTSMYQCKGVTQELESWRESIQIEDMISICKHPRRQDQLTAAILASGGLLDTMAAIRSGFKVIWGSEIDETMTKMWDSMTHAVNHGDAEGIDYSTIEVPDVVFSGMPCPDWTKLGSEYGEEGHSGYLYTKQIKWLITLKKRGMVAAVLEQTSNATTIANGKPVENMLNTLQGHFYVHYATIPVWKYGDVSNRQRLYIILFSKSLGQHGSKYKFPPTRYNTRHYPVGLDIATPDSEVDEEYLICQEPRRLYEWQEPLPGKIHKIGDFGNGIGHCDMPNPLTSWWGLPATQLTSNGGSRRVMLSWQPGTKSDCQRLSTIDETRKIASLMSSYVDWVKQFNNNDKFVRICINNGVPMRTGTAVANSVHEMIRRLKEHQDMRSISRVDTVRHANTIGLADMSILRSMMVDIGASGSLNYTDVGNQLQNRTPSKFRIDVAKEGSSMYGTHDGKLTIQVLNTAKHKGIEESTEFSFNTTTTDELRTELLSVDGPYRHGNFSLMLRQPDFESGVCELYRPASQARGMPECRIPIRYDYNGSGGWWIDYIIHPNPAEAHKQLLSNMIATNAHHVGLNNSNQCNTPTCTENEANEHIISLFQNKQVKKIRCYSMEHHEYEDDLRCYAAETVTILARHPDERQYKGVKAGLKLSRQKMKGNVFHKKYGHIGNCGSECWICRMVKGVMRRITLKVSPHRETRVGYLWYMDGVTWSHRSLKGNKYMVTLRDVASRAIFKLNLYLRSDRCYHLESFVNRLRSNPAFHGLTYRIFSVLVTDNAGEWCKQCTNWKEFEVRMKFQTRYTTPETSKELGIAESTNDIMEKHTKAFLMERNLPPNHWEICSDAAEFCLLRFPTVAADVTAPVDGDQERPLEKLTRGFKSRRQIDRELSNFEPPGQVALVHFKTKGSALEPRVRWGIAWGMYNEQVIWRCPYAKSLFRSRSYSVVELNDNINYGHFFKIKMETSRAQVALPGDMNETVDVHLEDPRTIDTRQTLPVTDVTDGGGKVKSVQIRPNQDLGGSARVFDSNGQQLMVDTKTGELHTIGHTESTRQGEPDNQTGRENPDFSGGVQDSGAMLDHRATGDRQPTQTDNDAMLGDNQTDNQSYDQLYTDNGNYEEYINSDNYSGIPTEDDNDDNDQDNLDKIAKIYAEKDCHKAGASLSFEKLCKQHNIPHEMHDSYYQWLMEQTTEHGMRFSQETIPRTRPTLQGGGYIEPGLMVPPPHVAQQG